MPDDQIIRLGQFMSFNARLLELNGQIFDDAHELEFLALYCTGLHLQFLFHVFFSFDDLLVMGLDLKYSLGEELEYLSDISEELFQLFSVRVKL